MSKPFHVIVLAPDAKIFDGEAVSMVVPGGEGYFGVLAQHAPLIASVIPGRIEIRAEEHGAPLVFTVKRGGFVEVSHNVVTLLAEEIAPAQETVAAR